jgi:hypothetical protein
MRKAASYADLVCMLKTAKEQQTTAHNGTIQAIINENFSRFSTSTLYGALHKAGIDFRRPIYQLQLTA